MLLRIEDLEEQADPGRTDIAEALQRLGNGEVEMVMLERRYGWFVRAGTSPDGKLWMLTADGTPRQHRQTIGPGVSIGQVAAAFAAYLDGDVDWSTGCNWQLIEPETWFAAVRHVLRFFGM